MKVLFIISDNVYNCDYLSDSIFHGLRLLLGANVVDYPKASRMYMSAAVDELGEIRGYGFTLYGLLDDIPVERPETLGVAYIKDAFDLVIVGDIWRSQKIFDSIRPALTPKNCIILDGADNTAPYGYSKDFWLNPGMWRAARTGRIPYYKREIVAQTLTNRSYKLIPRWLAGRLLQFAPWKTTAFAIPAEKVITDIPKKTKLMAAHVVDPEVAAHFDLSDKNSYKFRNESEYYSDLRTSRFGVTTKRAGWDCLRHYEIAANGCVPCFKDLDKKPLTCAPHGLNHTNCVIYSDLRDLLSQIETMDTPTYVSLQEGAMKWVRANTTVARAKELLRSTGYLSEEHA